MSDSEQQLFRHLLDVAHQVRSELLPEVTRPLHIGDIYSVCYYVVRELHSDLPDLRIMIGDRVSDHGLIQHHWLESISHGIFLDPVYDDIDSFQPVRIGRRKDPEFQSMYQNGMDAQFDVDDPRDRPEIMYRPHSAYDPESGPE